MELNGVAFNKRLGQNFLINPEIVSRIVNAADVSGFGVLEVGAGLGVLTSELVKIAKKVVSVEIDRGLFTILKKQLGCNDNLELLHADVLKLDFKRLVEDCFSGLPVKVCSNLPYYITSNFVATMLESGCSSLHSAILMIQKEAAVRLCARPGEKDCGAISCLVNYYSKPKVLFGVSKGNFFPVPKVDSSVVSLLLKRKKDFVVLDEKKFFQFIRVAFSQRRKVLVSPISKFYGIDKEVLKRVLCDNNIDTNVRAQHLSLKQFADLFNALAERDSFKLEKN